ncbi:MAG TPA: hypothetical protein VMU59_09165 [Caulobacteraceae bacterium]|nr:hypothetical protein [Caulobacteraceae bacterium]
MTAKPSLRRLIDLPGMAELERKALMKPAYAEEASRAEFPEIDELSLKLFGLTPDQADEIPRPEGWDRIERKPPAQQVFAFEDAGWDVTDDKRRPLRMLGQFSAVLWLALRGVAGTVPFLPDPDEDQPGEWGKGLAADAARFRKR